jgi:hypothetical protein
MGGYFFTGFLVGIVVTFWIREGNKNQENLFCDFYGHKLPK